MTTTNLPGVTLDRFVSYAHQGYYGRDVIRDGWALGRVLTFAHQTGGDAPAFVAVDSTGVHTGHRDMDSAVLAVVRRWEDRESILTRTGRSQIIG